LGSRGPHSRLGFDIFSVSLRLMAGLVRDVLFKERGGLGVDEGSSVFGSLLGLGRPRIPHWNALEIWEALEPEMKPDIHDSLV
jgi:hypothetical protein